jgi:UDP:flavonoid glycosyltransferase YjiC (YdhE family)
MIAIASELGSNLGHAARQLAIVAALRQRGKTVAYVAPVSSAVHADIQALGIATQPLAYSISHDKLPLPLNCFADILLCYGFARRAVLAKRLALWRERFTDLQATAVLIDYAPTALLAAHSMGLPVVQIGTGFEMPPTPFPTLTPWARPDHTAIAQSSALLLEVIQAALGGAHPDLTSLDAVFEQHPRFASGIAETDPYGTLRDQAAASSAAITYLGPVNGLAGAGTLPWPLATVAKPKRVFGYLRAGPHLAAILELLRPMPVSAVFIVPDLDRASCQALSNGNLLVSIHLVDSRKMLKQSDLCVCYGSNGMLGDALLAGASVFSVPTDIEKALNSASAARTGACIAVSGEGIAQHGKTVLNELLFGGSAQAAAKQIKQRYAQRDWASDFERLIDGLCVK